MSPHRRFVRHARDRHQKVVSAYHSNIFFAVFARALLMAMLRTAFFKQLATGGGGSFLLVGVLLTEGLMSFTTSSNVGFRARQQIPHFDKVWALGAMTGVLLGILAVHLVYHVILGRSDILGCMLGSH